MNPSCYINELDQHVTQPSLGPVKADLEEVRHPCAFVRLSCNQIVLNVLIYTGAWAWNVKIMTYQCTVVGPPLQSKWLRPNFRIGFVQTMTIILSGLIRGGFSFQGWIYTQSVNHTWDYL